MWRRLSLLSATVIMLPVTINCWPDNWLPQGDFHICWIKAKLVLLNLLLNWFPDQRPVVWTEEAVHVVHGPHDARRQGREERHQRMPVPVPEQPMELLHRRGLDRLRTHSIDPWVRPKSFICLSMSLWKIELSKDWTCERSNFWSHFNFPCMS